MDDTQSLLYSSTLMVDLALTDSEHLGAAYRADTLGCRLTILHRDTAGVPHLPLGTTLDTIRLHGHTSLFGYKE